MGGYTFDARLGSETLPICAADRDIWFQLGCPSEQCGRDRDEILLHDAIRDRELRPVFLHERLALLVGQPDPKLAGR